MDYIDERIIPMLNAQKREMQQRQLWNEELEAVVCEIKEGRIEKLGMEMEQRYFFDKNLALYMPKYFSKMTNEHIKLKYPNENRPDLLYTDDTDSMNIGISLIENEEDEIFVAEDVPAFRDVMIESFFAVSPASSIFDKGTITVGNTVENAELDETSISYYSFNSFVIGGAMYNLIFLALLGEALAIVSINCPIKNMEANKLLFYGIMHTAQVKAVDEIGR